MPTLHFISGLPRSGSTLLAGLLAQNPRFRCTGTSGLVDVLLLIRNQWDRLDEHRAMDRGESADAKERVLQAVLGSYHRAHTIDVRGGRAPGVIFDKSRSWLAHIEMAEYLLGAAVKVLVPVRDVRDILASLELLWRKNAPTRQIPYEAKNYLAFQSAHGRCAFWLAADGVLGIAYARLMDAFVRGLKDRLHIVRFEDLTHHPFETMLKVHDFLQYPYFKYNYEHVEQAAEEDDLAYGMPGLHGVRRTVQCVPSRWQAILGQVAAPFECMNYPLGYPPDSAERQGV